MRKSIWRTVAFLLAGAVLGTLAGELLASQLPILRQQTVISWSPSADLAFIRYTVNIVFRVNWLTLLGAVVALWFERKAK